MSDNATFDYTSAAVKVLFGAGRLADVANAVEGLGGRRCLVLSTPGRENLARDVETRLGGLAAAVFPGARMHTPVGVTENAMTVVASEGIDCLVAIGGGSTIGLAKAIAWRTGLPQVAIPTTYAGSEMTAVLGETAEGKKTTRRSGEVRPEVVIYDVDLTLTLPPRTSAVSGMNAMAHAVEALYAENRNPVLTLLAEDAIRTLAGGLPGIIDDPSDRAARTEALYGAWLCGMCLEAGVALHHKLCHVLGGAFDLPHAETHAVVLPYAVAYNASAAPDAMARIARALGTGDAVSGLIDLERRIGTPRSLREIGMPEEGIDRAARSVAANPYWNPRPMDEDALRDLLRAAWAGS